MFILKTMLQSVILLWKCAFRPGMSVFVMVWETRPLPVYPIVFRHPGLPVGGKHSVFNFIHRHVHSFLLVSLNWQPACACVSSLRRRGWWKKPSPIFWIWTATPSSILHTAPLSFLTLLLSPGKLFLSVKLHLKHDKQYKGQTKSSPLSTSEGEIVKNRDRKKEWW